MKTDQRCAWCHPGEPSSLSQSHGICPRHKREMEAESRALQLQMARRDVAAEVAGTYRELERAAQIDDARLDRLGEITTESGLMAARGVAIGFLGGLLILGTAWLAMLAL